MTKSVLVTGSRGVIGREVSRHLERKGHRVFGTLRPNQCLTKGKKEFELIPWKPIDVMPYELDCIVHIAGYYSNSMARHDLEKTFNSNIGIASSLAQLISKYKIPIVAVGSFSEKFPGELGLSYYAASKVAGKDILRSASGASEVTFDYVYLYDTYGGSTIRKKFIDLLLEMTESSEKLFASSGLQVQDLVYIEDIAIGIEELVRRTRNDGGDFREWQIRTGETRTLRAIADIVSEIRGFELKIDWGKLSDRERDNYSLWDCAPNLISIAEMTHLKSGIIKMGFNH